MIDAPGAPPLRSSASPEGPKPVAAAPAASEITSTASRRRGSRASQLLLRMILRWPAIGSYLRAAGDQTVKVVALVAILSVAPASVQPAEGSSSTTSQYVPGGRSAGRAIEP